MGQARATHGAHAGTWYYEVTVTHLGATGHARLGWATDAAELQAPVGFDLRGFAYRDLEGSKVGMPTRTCARCKLCQSPSGE